MPTSTKRGFLIIAAVALLALALVCFVMMQEELSHYPYDLDGESVRWLIASIILAAGGAAAIWQIHKLPKGDAP